MNRRDFLSRMPASVAGASALLQTPPATAGMPAQTPASSSGSRPNILFLIADDLTFRALDPTQPRQVKTPHLDRLTAQGCRFSHCFHQGAWDGAICVPSRTMLNTGLSTFKAQKAIPANESCTVPTWGQTFRAAGYDTFITGKWHLDAVSLDRSFAHQHHVGPGFLPSTPDAYDRPAPGNHWDPANEQLAGHWLPLALWQNQPGPAIEHSSCLYADAAIEFLERRPRQHAAPFFMYIGFNAPHDPRQAPQSFLDLYPTDSIEVPPNFLPEHPFDQGMARTRDELLAPFPRTPVDIQVHRREYYAIISHMDAQVGRILAALDATGEANNTYIVFTADHGLAVGEHGLMGKQNQYECSMHMPLLVRGPGIAPGRTVDALVYQHCLFATTCDLAGIPIPSHVDFPSLRPHLLAASAPPLYDSVFGWLSTLQRSLRTSQYRLITYPPLGRTQLFDLQADPWELHDLAPDPAHAATLHQLQQDLHRRQHELGDPLAPTSA